MPDNEGGMRIAERSNALREAANNLARSTAKLQQTATEMNAEMRLVATDESLLAASSSRLEANEAIENARTETFISTMTNTTREQLQIQSDRSVNQLAEKV